MAKSTKSGKANKKVVSGGMIVAVVAIVLVIACFFTYISGILPRTLTGVSITETLPDGTTRTVRNYSLLETNMHFKEVFSNYANYGMVSEELLDTIYNESTGETYRDWLLRETANQMKTLALVERAANESGFMQYSKARDYASVECESIEGMSALYGYPSAQQYMAAMYGTGMTTRSYIDFYSREILVQEYGSYLKQFDPAVVPTAEQIQAKFDENPYVYYIYDFNRYFIMAEKDEEGNIIGSEKALEAANKIAAATTDSASFRQAVIDYLTEENNEASLATFEDDADPTYNTGYTYESIQYMDQGIQDFSYSDSKVGDTTVVETSTGCFVIYLADKKLDETQTVDYRVLALTNEAAVTGATPEAIAQGAQDLAAEAATYCTNGMDAFSFYNIVKDHSEYGQAMLDGGYNSGVTADAFASSDENAPLELCQVQAGMWLFEEGRQPGDVKIIISDDQRTVYVYYFEASHTAWENAVRNDMINTNFNAWNAALSTGNVLYEVNAGLMQFFIY